MKEKILKIIHENAIKFADLKNPHSPIKSANGNLRIKDYDAYMKGALDMLEQIESYLPVEITETLPSDEVIAINDCNEYLVGYIHKDETTYICSDENTQLEDVTHYIKLNKIN